MESTLETCKQVAEKIDPVGCETSKAKKYSREELFKFAKQMRGDGPPIEELDKFEKAQYDVVGEDALPPNDPFDEQSPADGKRFGSIRTLSALGRQRSELSYEFNSLNNNYRYNNNNGLVVDNDLSRRLSSGSKHRVVSRMTSSPSIKYNNKRATSGQLDEYDGISIQARAKYERLIESCSNATGHQPPMLAMQSLGKQSTVTRQSPLTRTVSNNSWLANNGGQQQHKHHQKPLERSAQQFGPLRREAIMPRQGRRNSSDEPHSLPYFSANMPPPESNWSKPTMNQSSTKLLSEDFSNSPITRISATSDNSGTNEEDDFDITSLLSITVLSDIKTIRHDLQGSNRQPVGLSAKQTAGKSRSQDAPMRPLNRARTATDFTYNGRHSRDVGNHRPRTNNLYLSSGYRSSGAESLSYWPQHYQLQHHSEHQHRDYIPRDSQPSSLTDKNTRDQRRDSTQAKIIEMFKVQVMERALAKEPPPPPSQPIIKPTESNNDSAKKLKGAESEAVEKEHQRRGSLARRSPERRKSSTSTIEKEASSQESSNIEVCSPKAPVDGTVKSRDEQKVNSDCAKVEPMKPARYVSSIPRLVSLHKAKLNASPKTN